MNLKYLYHSNTNSDMFRNKANLTTALFFSDFFLASTMAQSDIIIKKSGDINTISIAAENARPAATLLQSYLNQSFLTHL
jgi:hypothetical protein